MKPWWDNPDYHSATVDGKIAAWESRCKAIERQLQAALDHERLKVAALCEALDNPAQSSEQWGRWADARATSARHDRQVFDYRGEFERLRCAVEQAVASRFASHAANGVLESAVKQYDEMLPNAALMAQQELRRR